ncbi:MAG: M23 family metallopeptidase [Pseudonocardia sp.]
MGYEGGYGELRASVSPPYPPPCSAEDQGRGPLPLLLAAAAAAALLLADPPTDSGSAVVAPVPGGRVSSGYGPRPGGMHHGTDIAAPLGTPIRAVTDATVIEAGPASGFGLWVRLRHDRDDTVSVYGHMHTITTRVGAHLTAGDQIATVGSRGRSTGPHLHLEIWPEGRREDRVDPADWMTAHGTPVTGGRS